jgi:ParB-like chromosome segregation protein Spo0J
LRLKLDEIFIGERQRKDYGRAELEALQKDLEENGQITAVTVRPISDYDRAEEGYSGEPWALVAGGRRVMAAALNGWPDIEAYAREEMKELTHRVLELHENLHRKEMSWQEVVDAKKELARLRRIENPDITDGEIARELGQSASSFSRDVKTAQLLESNPGLRTAGSKNAALNAGKLLEEHQQRVNRISSQPSRADLGILPVEERIRTAEALDFVRQLPARSIDLGLFDGPYGYGYWKAGQKSGSRELSGEVAAHLSFYDDDPERTGELYRAFLPEAVRVLRETGWLVFFCGKETYDFIEELAQDCCAIHGSYRHAQYPSQCDLAVVGATAGGTKCRFLSPEPYPWIWYRPNSRNQPRYAYLHAKNYSELILVINMGKGRLCRPGTPNVKVHDADYGSERVHANQKPVAIYRDLIQDFTFAGDSVLDCFYGSGNSLAASASLSRVPWGCDKNPEMRQFALAAVQKYGQPLTKEAIEASHRRYQQGLQMQPPEEVLAEVGFFVDDAPDMQVIARAEVEPFTVSRAGAAGFTYEIFELPDYTLGYIKYDGHNMGQRRGKDGTDLEAHLQIACERLNQLSALGVLDPCCCSPEEAMAALKQYEAAEEEDA